MSRSGESTPSAVARLELVSPAARALTARTVRSDDRVLVTGGGGWFGRTMLDLLAGHPAHVMVVASRERDITVAGREYAVKTVDLEAVEEFAPTVVVDCAFLTRDRVDGMDLARYVAINRELTAFALGAAGLDTVRLAVTVSSGAAVHPVDAFSQTLEDNPYGWLKREAERAMLTLAPRRGVCVARAWSVSGAYNQHPENYALADMIRQAEDGVIAVRASSPVLRRYALADELLALALARADVAAGTGAGEVLDSGGVLVEMGELAQAVRRVVNPRAEVRRGPVSGTPHAYFSDGEAWLAAAAAAQLELVDLDGQIRLTWAGLTAAG